MASLLTTAPIVFIRIPRHLGRSQKKLIELGDYIKGIKGPSVDILQYDGLCPRWVAGFLPKQSISLTEVQIEITMLVRPLLF
jgi:hypothetical protein